MAALSICRKNLLSKLIGRSRSAFCRSISTSEKKKEASEACPSDSGYKKVPDFSKPSENKNWVSYGTDEEDKFNDRFRTHLQFFSVFTIVMCGIGFGYLYYPDLDRINWARREAFIRLYEREQLGLEPIDMNYIDPKKIVLPPDEELSDEDIII